MKTFYGNPYNVFEYGDVICTTTNGIVKKDGKAVMGAGNAKFVRDTFKVDELLGKYLLTYGNRSFILGEYAYQGKLFTLVTFPTKNHWRDKSDLSLIEKSTNELIQMSEKYNWKRVFVPMAGCSNGQLSWSQVKPILSKLDDRFIVYSLDLEDFYR